MSGPVRGGKGVLINQQSRDLQAAKLSSSSGSKSTVKKKKKEEPRPKVEPAEKKDSTKSSADSSQPSSSKKKKKRPVTESGGAESDGSKKKAARAIPLATGDRNTLATEIASGPWYDFAVADLYLISSDSCSYNVLHYCSMSVMMNFLQGGLSKLTDVQVARLWERLIVFGSVVSRLLSA